MEMFAVVSCGERRKCLNRTVCRSVSLCLERVAVLGLSDLMVIGRLAALRIYGKATRNRRMASAVITGLSV